MVNNASSKNKCGNIKHLATSNIQCVTMEKAPLKYVSLLPMVPSELEVLPDSGADILTTEQEVLQHLNEHVSCLSFSVVIPKSLNSTKLYPLGKVSVHLHLGYHEYDDKLHIYLNTLRALLLWKASKGLGDST